MRTNQKVFISSTFRDLQQHRRALIDALLDVAWLTVMESRGAAPGTIAANCLNWVQRSDVYVGILGMRYGSREPSSGLSFTELEYNEAMRLKLPCLVYMIDEERHPLLPGEVDRGKDAEDLEKLKTRIRTQNLTGLFKSPDHLAYRVIKDIFALFDDQDEQRPLDHSPAAHDSGLGIRAGWHIQLCAWGSPDGGLCVDPSSTTMRADEADADAAILVSRFARGDFSDLRHVVSLRPEIRNALRSFLSVRDIDEVALASEIGAVNQCQYTRLLVDLAGLTASAKCVQAICQTILVTGPEWDREIREKGYAYQMSSFLDVCVDALGRMPSSCAHTVAHYVDRARETRRWRAKAALDKAMRRINRGFPGSH